MNALLAGKATDASKTSMSVPPKTLAMATEHARTPTAALLVIGKFQIFQKDKILK